MGLQYSQIRSNHYLLELETALLKASNVLGTRRSANPATKDQTKAFAKSGASFGPQLLKSELKETQVLSPPLQPISGNRLPATRCPANVRYSTTAAIAPTIGGVREYMSNWVVGKLNSCTNKTFGKSLKLYNRVRALKNAPRAPIIIIVAIKGGPSALLSFRKKRLIKNGNRNKKITSTAIIVPMNRDVNICL
jgi:hypothetical protein